MFEKEINNKSFFITGATGLIGTALVTELLEKYKGVKVYALVRSIEKAERVFSAYIGSDSLTLVKGDITDSIALDDDVDYIVHAASQTSSKGFIETPVETISTALNGTQNVLEFAKGKNVKGFVYLSTMEVYGTPTTDEKITESHPTNLDTTNVRSCYPISKRMCENMCVCYCKEYGVPCRIIRLTQTFGEGVQYNDGRVFAEFARCAIESRDIVLHTKGETKRNYLYTGDAVSAILCVLARGENGQAYNAANEATYCSIYEMASMVAEKLGGGNIGVKIIEEDVSKFGFAPVLHMNLSVKKLCDLGWEPTKDLEEMYDVMIADMKRSVNK